jgi:F-type H+-transporting ATPase subunit a
LAYIGHFFGPKELREGGIHMLLMGIFFGVIIFGIEIISHAIRPVTLGLRVTGNMTGDHNVLAAFIQLVPIGVPIVFYILGLFVCFMQAFVFTVLSTVYILLASAHEEEHH